MKEITVQVYTFAELSPKVQARLIEKAKPMLHETYDAEYLTEQFKDLLKAINLDQLEPLWSLGYSQGDGVAFEGTVNLDDVLSQDVDELRAERPYAAEIVVTLALGPVLSRVRRATSGNMNIYFEVTNRHHYTHWNSFSVSASEYTDTGNLAGKVLSFEGWGRHEGEDDSEFEDRFTDAEGALEREIERELAELASELRDALSGLSRKLERYGYDDIEASTNDEAAREFLMNHDAEYLENGRQW